MENDGCWLGFLHALSLTVIPIRVNLRASFGSSKKVALELGADRSMAEFDEHSVDWDSVRKGIRSRLARKLYDIDPSEIDDLAQETVLGVLRTVRREGIRKNIEALMTVAAHRTAINFFRRKALWLKLIEPMTDQVAETHYDKSPPSASDIGPRIRFQVLEFFAAERSCLKLKCADIAKGVLGGSNKRVIAAEMGLTYDSLRQRWKRCQDRLRAHAVSSAEFLELLETSYG